MKLNSLEEPGLVFVFLVVSELYLTLYSSKGASLLLSNRMSGVENGVPCLYVEQRELDGISAVDILIGEEVFPTE